MGFKLQDQGLILFRETCHVKKNQNKAKYYKIEKILLSNDQIDNRKDQWLDFLIHVNWSFEEDGFINNELGGSDE